MNINKKIAFFVKLRLPSYYSDGILIFLPNNTVCGLLTCDKIIGKIDNKKLSFDFFKIDIDFVRRERHIDANYIGINLDSDDIYCPETYNFSLNEYGPEGSLEFVCIEYDEERIESVERKFLEGI